MSQDVRNKIYGTVSGLVGIAVIIGVVDQATTDEALVLTDAVLELGSQIIALAGLITAFVKSLPSKVTTIEEPRSKIANVEKTNGEIIPVR